jgi:hypothetical protein
LIKTEDGSVAGTVVTGMVAIDRRVTFGDWVVPVDEVFDAVAEVVAKSIA